MSDNVVRVGVIVTGVAELESLLVKLGGDGAGLHEKADSCRALLPETLLKSLHFIASVRNRAAHQSGEISDAEFDAFRDACFQAKIFLESKLAESPAPPAVAGAGATEPEGRPAGTTQQAAGSVGPKRSGKGGGSAVPDEIAVERELLYEFDSFCRTCAFIPVLQVIYLLRLFLRAFARSVPSMTALVLALSSLPLIYVGCRQHEDTMLYAGLALFALTYLYGVCRAWARRADAVMPLYVALIPLLNIVYFTYWAFIAIAWPKFMTALILSCGFAAGVVLVLKLDNYRPGLIVLALSYLLCAGAGLFEKTNGSQLPNP